MCSLRHHVRLTMTAKCGVRLEVIRSPDNTAPAQFDLSGGALLDVIPNPHANRGARPAHVQVATGCRVWPGCDAPLATLS